MKSIENRVARLEKKAEFETALPLQINARIVLAETREDALRLAALPPIPVPIVPRINVVASGPVTASEYLAERGVEPPQLETPNIERNEHETPTRAI